METLMSNGHSRAPVLASPVALPLRERARVALETETAMAIAEERQQRDTELRNRRDTLLRLMREVLGELIEPKAIPLPEDSLASQWTDITVTVDGLNFRAAQTQAQCLEGQHHLRVSFRCPVCQEATWHSVLSLGALGLLLQQEADGLLAELCSTCLMAAEFEADPFRDE